VSRTRPGPRSPAGSRTTSPCPKPNLYQSLHTAVIGPRGERIEIQIRTREMNLVAEHGIAAHWKYKDGSIASVDDKKFAWLRQ